MKTIPLTRGKVAVVDDEDYEILSKYKWNCSFYGYAVCHKYIGGYKSIAIRMHRLVMDATSNLQVDHINGDRLDNCKENLRLCTNRFNAANQKVKSTNTSGYKGVVWEKRRHKWVAGYMLNYKQHYIGQFSSPIEAARAYNAKAVEVWGEYAKINEC